MKTGTAGAPSLFLLLWAYFNIFQSILIPHKFYTCQNLFVTPNPHSEHFVVVLRLVPAQSSGASELPAVWSPSGGGTKQRSGFVFEFSCCDQVLLLWSLWCPVFLFLVLCVGDLVAVENVPKGSAEVLSSVLSTRRP